MPFLGLDGSVFVLGAQCWVSKLARQLRLTGERYGPFDWVGTTPGIVQHCLLNGFRDFLNPHMYVHGLDSQGRPVVNHTLYSAVLRSLWTGEVHMFMHHDTSTEPLQSILSRRVDRFNEAYIQNEPMTFIFGLAVERENSRLLDVFEEEAYNWYRWLLSHRALVRMHIFLVEHNTGQHQLMEASIGHLNQGCKLTTWRLRATHMLRGATFNPLDLQFWRHSLPRVADTLQRSINWMPGVYHALSHDWRQEADGSAYWICDVCGLNISIVH